MNPKEKAAELIEKYLNTIIHFPYIDTEDGNCIGTGYMTYNSAKDCAIIAVDIILIDCGAVDWAGDEASEGKNYWQEVKKELTI